MNSSGGIDVSGLSKGQLRKLRALRKSVGVEIGERAFAEWLASQAGSSTKADANAAVIVRNAVADGRAGRAGDPARRLPGQARTGPHYRGGSEAVEGWNIRRVPAAVLLQSDPRWCGTCGCAGAGFPCLDRLPRESLIRAAGGGGRQPAVVHPAPGRAIIESAFADGPPPGCGSGGYHDVSAAMGGGVGDDFDVLGIEPGERQARRHLGGIVVGPVIAVRGNLDDGVPGRCHGQPAMLGRAHPGPAGARLAGRGGARPGAGTFHRGSWRGGARTACDPGRSSARAALRAASLAAQRRQREAPAGTGSRQRTQQPAERRLA